MNTLEKTNQMHDSTKTVARTTPTGFRRRTLAGALLVMALTASAVGFAAASHADDNTAAPGTGPAPAAPPPAAALPWPVPPLAPWLDGIIDGALRPHVHCGFRPSDDKYRCSWS